MVIVVSTPALNGRTECVITKREQNINQTGDVCELTGRIRSCQYRSDSSRFASSWPLLAIICYLALIGCKCVLLAKVQAHLSVSDAGVCAGVSAGVDSNTLPPLPQLAYSFGHQ